MTTDLLFSNNSSIGFSRVSTRIYYLPRDAQLKVGMTNAKLSNMLLGEMGKTAVASYNMSDFDFCLFLRSIL